MHMRLAMVRMLEKGSMLIDLECRIMEMVREVDFGSCTRKE